MRRARFGFLVMLLAVSAAGAAAEEFPATLHWAQRVELSTPVSGVIHQVTAGVGDRVSEGDPLLRLDPRPFQTHIAKAEALLASRREKRAEAERERDRARQLYERTVLSTHELQLAEIAFTEADAEFKEAKAQLSSARLELEYSVVRAPFDARVVARQAEPGETVVTRLQSTPLLVVAEAGRMVARARVAAERAQTIEPGQAATVVIDDVRFEGKVAGVGLEPVAAEAEAPRYAVAVAFSFDSDRTLRAGQRATVLLP